MILFLKTHVEGYTRKDGTYVAAHEDKRAAARSEVKPSSQDHLLQGGDGKPIAVHHGSPNDFDEFDPEQIGNGTNSRSGGFWFTDDQLQAWAYADPSHKGKGTMKTVHLSMKKPMELDAMEEARKLADDLGIDSTEDWEQASELLQYNDWIADQVSDAKRAGYDGLIVRNTGDAPTHSQSLANHYVVFEPEQIVYVQDQGRSLKKSAPVLLFFKGFIGPYMRGGKMVNLKGYHSARTKTVRSTTGQSALFADLAPPPEVKQTAKVARALTTWMQRHGGPAGMSRLLEGMSPEHQEKLVDAMAKIGKTDADTVRGMLAGGAQAQAAAAGSDLFGAPDSNGSQDTITMPRAEAVKEHERLVDVLNSPSHKDDEAEAKKQAEELKEYKGGGGEPDALSMTPKQYHEAKLLHVAQEYKIPLSRVHAAYDTEAGRKNNEQEWVNSILQAAKEGKELGRKTLDKLHEVRPGAVGQLMHDYPEAKLPDGYQVPDARKVEKEEKAARAANKKAVSPKKLLTVEPGTTAAASATAKQPTKAQQTRARRQAVLDVLGDGWKADAGVDGAKDQYSKSVKKPDGGRFEVTIMPEKTVEGDFYVGSYHYGGKRRGGGSSDSSAKTIEEAKAIADRIFAAVAGGDSKPAGAGLAATKPSPDEKPLTVQPGTTAAVGGGKAAR